MRLTARGSGRRGLSLLLFVALVCIAPGVVSQSVATATQAAAELSTTTSSFTTSNAATQVALSTTTAAFSTSQVTTSTDLAATLSASTTVASAGTTSTSASFAQTTSDSASTLSASTVATATSFLTTTSAFASTAASSSAMSKTPRPPDSCVGLPPPFPDAVCVGSTWIVDSGTTVTGNATVTRPVLVNGAVSLNDPIIVITPSGGIVATGEITGNATILIDLTKPPANGTLVTLLDGAALNATYTVTLRYPISDCRSYTSQEERTASTLNALILVHDSTCRSGLSRSVLIGIIAGAIGFAALLLVLLLLAYRCRHRLPAVNWLFRPIKRRRDRSHDYMISVSAL